ncbi:hypothetical protein W97_06326 [Coniosporium apollinis CBS 100218]|uniref:C3H1-type domain-containing protein n=1 Tax=Coniosporium apollinis (strain CBS 100218) TaxID=1168221 RepID=R7YYD6_CONA1|nr:uncharacterized protein W97_06326 [Coniosporium apollinis CBS 100218]EON66922.1 hypothetical protein W97_06326 [Coniosporium apollinis CBS 100218]
MLTESSLDALTTQLTGFRNTSEQQHAKLETLLKSYEDLLEDYRSLRSDYEEEREVREKYKKRARGQERNPFVLVLIDGDGYVFNDHLIKNGGEGGIAAAQGLSSAIKQCLLRLGSDADQCRIMVRVYSNLAGLSKILARHGMAGNEARSLAPFAASFTRSHDLFDFVDAGDKKEGADFKIREMFRLFAENSQCKHIFFAGCHDTGYLSLLTPYRGRLERVSLIKAASFSPEYLSLGLNVEEFPSIFRSTMLQYPGAAPAASPEKASTGQVASKYAPPTPGSTSQTVCRFYPKGSCRYGNACKNIHIASTHKLAEKPVTDYRTAEWRSSTPSTNPYRPPSARPETPAGLDDPLAHSTAPELPSQTPDKEGLIPLNSRGDRLDYFIPPASPGAWQAYTARAKTHKMCNKFHIEKNCQDINCPFDHKPVEPELIHVMKVILSNRPCPRRGGCRREMCPGGHICKRPGCQGPGDHCKFAASMHRVDTVPFEWVEPVGESDSGSDAGKDTTPNGFTSPTDGGALIDFDSYQKW